MAEDIATLGIRVDALEAKAAARELDELAKKGDNAEKSSKKLTSATDILKRAMEGLGIITTVNGAIDALTVGMQKSVGAAKEYSMTMGEISTLVDTNVWSMEKLNKEIRNQAVLFGSQPLTQAAAMYEIISSGATDAADATETLTVSNKLAVAGVTDVATASDGLTSVINAYGKEVLTATAASDAMFVAMVYGKTTIGEMSAKLGTVAPLAATLGVSFDELTASVAALTKGGVSTDIALTGIRAVLATVAKPSEEAAELAKKLGLNFTSAGLRAQGFGAFMEEVKAKTKGNTDQMALLFGGVEALVPALAMTGAAGQSFNEIMEEMKNKAGATDEALAKINGTNAQKINQILSGMEVAALNVGNSILDFLSPALTELAGVMTGAHEPGLVLDTIMKALALTMGVIAVRSTVALTAAIIKFVATTVMGSTAVMGFTAMVTTMGVRSAVATVAVTGLRTVLMGTMALLGGPWGVALAAAAGAIYFLTTQVDDGVSSQQELAAKTGATVASLQSLEERAKDNIAKQDRLAAAARSAGGGMAEAAGKAAAFEQRLIKLGVAAQYATLQAAKLGLTEAQNNFNRKSTAFREADEDFRSYRAKPGKAAQEMASGMAATRSVTRGRAVEALSAKRVAEEQVRLATEDFNKALKGGPALPVVPLPTVSTASGDDTKKKDKGGGKSEAERRIEESEQVVKALQEEAAQMGKTQFEIKQMEIATAAAAAPTAALRQRILDAGDAWEVAAENAAFAELATEAWDKHVRAQEQAYTAGDAKFKQLANEKALIGANAHEREIAAATFELEALKVLEGTAAYEKYRDAIIEAAESRGMLAQVSEDAELATRQMKDFGDSITNATEGFGELFGTAGRGFENLIETIADYSNAQAELDERMARARQDYNEGQMSTAEFEYEIARANRERADNEIANYGNMINAAKTFFKEGSTGWKIMEAAEKGYRLFQFAMQIKAMFLDKASTASSVANSGMRAAADGVAAIAKAIASLPFPLNIAAGAATAAALIAFGVKVLGGGKGKGTGTDSAERQEAAYTGPRDAYGAPTSSYSVLKAGGVTVANDNPSSGPMITRGSAPASNFGGGSFRGGDLVINGGADRRTVEELQPVFQAWSKKTVEDARQASAADRATSSGRQRIGGGS